MKHNILVRALPVLGQMGWLRPSLGALLGISLTGLVCQLWLDGNMAHLPFLIAPIGATAVLLFVLPASPMARPWPVLAGNMVSALVAWLVMMTVPDMIWAAGLAVALSIAAMSLTRSLHPAGAGVALSMVLGGPAVAEAGWLYALVPVGLNAAILLALAWAFNNATGHSYPHHAPVSPPEAERVSDLAWEEEINRLLDEYGDVLDIGRDDLSAILRQLQARMERGQVNAKG